MSCSCNLMGGLGNQLFQIFTTIAYARDNQIPFYFSSEYNLYIGTARHTYWNTFLKGLKEMPNVMRDPIKKDDLSNLNTSVQEAFAIKGLNKRVGNQIMVLREKEFAYNNIYSINLSNKKLIKEIRLHGYYQSAKYFQGHRDAIFEMIRLFECKQDIIERNPVYKYLISDDSGITISLHFRLGDYKKLQDTHPVLTKEYYLSALLYVMKSLSILNNNNNIPIKVVYFCEESDLPDVLETIDFLKQQIQSDVSLVFEKVESSLDDWEQMLLMSLFKYNIIANSTFSWWAAYFNTNPNKIVCCPKKWFGTRIKHDTKDLYLDEWIKI